MRAYCYKKYGPPEVLELVEIPTPVPSETEVLIKTYATTVSSADWRVRSMTMPAGMGMMARLFFGWSRPRKEILGTELSGVISAVGSKVTQFEIGDPVIAFPGETLGAHAEYVVMPQDGKVVIKPDCLSFEEAAALSFGGTTAYDFLINKAQLKPGETVLINGASGSTGTAFVQLAKHFGAQVTGVCSGSNAEMVRGLGADDVIDYTQADFVQDGRRFDMIIDTVGTAPWARSGPALAPGGRLLAVSGTLASMIFDPLRARLSGKRIIGGVASEDVSLLRALTDLAKQGKFRPAIDRCYGFDQMIEAHRHVDTGRKKGNVVVVLEQT